MKIQKGFSLIELMITVAIIGILASIAVPAYGDYVLRGKLTEAMSHLADMRVRLEQYYQDNRTYVGGCPAITDAKYFAFTCPALTATSYVATATGIAAQGTGSFVYTIDQTNAKATTGVPTGWATNAACWVTKKGGVC